MELYEADIGSHNLVVDLHYYNLFDPFFDHLSPSENIEIIYKNRQTQIQALNSANGPLVFVGKPRTTSVSLLFFRCLRLSNLEPNTFLSI